MQPATLKAFQEHAIEAFPKEACGLIAVVNGRERYFPCNNASTGAEDHFVITGQQFADVEDQGEIMAIAHSHPNAAATPSQADLVSCEQHGYPWFIVSTHRDDDGYVAASEPIEVRPTGYQAPLVGRVFSHGILDCYALVRDYYRIHHDIALPNYERSMDWWHEGQDLYEDNFRDAGFSVITDEPRPGDVILMQIRADVINHAGIYLGDGVMLHHMINRLSSRDPYGGYWMEVTRKIIRHKDLA